MAWLLGRCLSAGVWRPSLFQVVLFSLGLLNWTISRAQIVDICKSGKMQSPINIVADDTVPKPFGPFNFTTYGTPSKDILRNFIYNDGSTVRVVPVGATQFISGGGLPGDYQLKEFHFHWGADDDSGSEHTLSGFKFPMELHIVHFRVNYSNFDSATLQPDGLAVLAFLFEISDNNNTDPLLLSVLKVISLVQTSGVPSVVPGFPVRPMLPTNIDNFYRYKGGVTTPPCYESVIWTVFSNTIRISDVQMTLFRNVVIKGNSNFRAVQNLNNRTVYRSFEKLLTSRQSSAIAIRASVLLSLLLAAVASLFSRAF